MIIVLTEEKAVMLFCLSVDAVSINVKHCAATAARSVNGAGEGVRAWRGLGLWIGTGQLCWKTCLEGFEGEDSRRKVMAKST